jgi:NDP-sugar pyrophosphorylase family protein
MADSLAGVVLAAGVGERLRPLTWFRPKVLCPVGDRSLLDLNVDRLGRLVAATDTAVNVHHHRGQLEAHLAGRHPAVHVSIEAERPLGTAGAIGRLRDWIDGRPVLVVNGDSWSEVALAPLLAGWDGERVRVLVPGGAVELGPTVPVAGTLLPAGMAAGLTAEPSGLYAEVWRPAARDGRLELVPGTGRFVDCGTPAAYLAANLTASGGRAVIGTGAVVEPGATIVGSVLWPGAEVRSTEALVDAIRTDRGVTVLVRRAGRRRGGARTSVGPSEERVVPPPSAGG